MELDQVIQFIKTLSVEDAATVMEATRRHIDSSKKERFEKLFSSEEQGIRCFCVHISQPNGDGEEFGAINFEKGEDNVCFYPYVTKTPLGYILETQIIHKTWSEVRTSTISLFPGSPDVEDMEFMNAFEDKLGTLLPLVKQCMMLIHKNRNALPYQLLETGWMDKQIHRPPAKETPEDDSACATPSSSGHAVGNAGSFAKNMFRQFELESEARVLRGSYKEDKEAIQQYLKHYELKLQELENQRLKRLLTDTEKGLDLYMIDVFNTRAVSWQEENLASRREFRVGFRVGEDKFKVILRLLCVTFHTECGHCDKYASQEIYTSFVSTIDDEYNVEVAPAFSGDWFSEKRSILIAGELLDHCRASFTNHYEKVWKCINLVAENLDDIMF